MREKREITLRECQENVRDQLGECNRLDCEATQLQREIEASTESGGSAGYLLVSHNTWIQLPSLTLTAMSQVSFVFPAILPFLLLQNLDSFCLKSMKYLIAYKTEVSAVPAIPSLLFYICSTLPELKCLKIQCKLQTMNSVTHDSQNYSEL